MNPVGLKWEDVNCYVCDQSDKQETSVATCRFCSVALCATHLGELRTHTQGRMHYPCDQPIDPATSK
ncbi:MAG TPA: hypothetical protein DGO43_09465 [Chloroflexi bacterium]|nr:hypothetical protein [Chloroflexota bacterium]